MEIINSNLNIEKVMSEINPHGVSHFLVEYENLGSKYIRVITVMKYNPNKYPKSSRYDYAVFPEKPSPVSVAWPPTDSNLFDMFPSQDIQTDDELEIFLLENYAAGYPIDYYLDDDADAKWNLRPGTISKACEMNKFSDYEMQRWSGGWFVTGEGMRRLYGKK